MTQIYFQSFFFTSRVSIECNRISFVCVCVCQCVTTLTATLLVIYSSPGCDPRIFQDSRFKNFLLKCVGITNSVTFSVHCHSSCATWAYYTLQLFLDINMSIKLVTEVHEK